MRTNLIAGDQTLTCVLQKQEYIQGELIQGKVSASSGDWKDVALNLLMLKQDEKKTKAPVVLGQWPVELVPSEVDKLDRRFSFKLGSNGIVSDEASGFYLQIQHLKEAKFSNLFLKTNPLSLYASIIEVLERMFRFKSKKYYGLLPPAKFVTKMISIKEILEYESKVLYEFKAPESKEFGHCTKFDLSLSKSQDCLQLEISSTWKKIEMSGLVMATKNVKKTTSGEWPLSKILQSGKDFDHEWVQKNWQDLLQEVKEKLV